MQVMDDRKRLSEIVEISIPSSQMEPAVGSHRRHNATSRELFPLPVLPQIPTLCPGWTSNEIPLSTRGSSDRYRICNFSNLKPPCEGHSGGGSSTTPCAAIAPVSSSDGSLVYSSMRSTLTICDSSSDTMRITQDKTPVMSMA